MSCSSAQLDEVKRKTTEHWNRSDDAEWYIQNLLPLEMECAQQRVEECDTLALLIGFSEDPLLQTIWKYRPQRIVLVLNFKYFDNQGKAQSGTLRAEEWIEHIKIMIQQGFCPETAIPQFGKRSGERNDIAIAAEEAKPDWVFRELRDRLLPDQRAGKRIVVDITGAKKNMASGAFLFAAYAGGDISYVDFEEYHPQKRRPLGYTCRIGTQPNPYRILGLRDWERVQKLYEQFAFGSAAVEVKQIFKTMDGSLADADGSGTYFSDEQRQSVERLEKVLSVLDMWDNGDYTSAWQLWQTPDKDGGKSLQCQMPGFPLPHVIEYLGSQNWPSAAGKDASAFLQEHRELKRGTTTPADSIFNHPDLLLAYAFDERDKINRLIRCQNDYRSAFLRSAGLDELLLKARIAILWLSDNLLLSGKPRTDFSDEHLKFGGLADYASADNLRDFLFGVNRRNPNDPATLRIRYWDAAQQKDVALSRKHSSVLAMSEYWNHPECTINHETLVDLRGEAIHTHLSIPVFYAHAAYNIVDQALKDCVDNWVPLLKKQIPAYQPWQLSWSDLCTHCRLDFLPALPSSKEQAT
jgi:hypothetical protein